MMATCTKFRSALTTSSTSTSFTAQVLTTTEPSGDGVFDLLSPALGWGGGSYVPNWLQLVPYGTNGDNDTFDFRVWGYSEGPSSTYVPQLLLDVSVVLGAATATPLAANTFLADTVTINDGAIDGVFRNHVDAQEDLVASIIVHTKGCRYIKFDWDLAGAQEGVTMNCLVRPVDNI